MNSKAKNQQERKVISSNAIISYQNTIHTSKSFVRFLNNPADVGWPSSVKLCIQEVVRWYKTDWVHLQLEKRF